MPCSGRCWAGSSGVGDGGHLGRLAALVVDRIGPALPRHVTLRVAELGVIAISDSTTWSEVTVQFSRVGGWSADDVLVRVVDALNDIGSEVIQATTDHYESDAEITFDAIRIWFGLVPAGSPEGAWRDVVPELQPIPLAAITPA
jgi:hypothetical protein